MMLVFSSVQSVQDKVVRPYQTDAPKCWSVIRLSVFLLACCIMLDLMAKLVGEAFVQLIDSFVKYPNP